MANDISFYCHNIACNHANNWCVSMQYLLNYLYLITGVGYSCHGSSFVVSLSDVWLILWYQRFLHAVLEIKACGLFVAYLDWWGVHCRQRAGWRGVCCETDPTFLTRKRGRVGWPHAITRDWTWKKDLQSGSQWNMQYRDTVECYWKWQLSYFFKLKSLLDCVQRLFSI